MTLKYGGEQAGRKGGKKRGGRVSKTRSESGLTPKFATYALISFSRIFHNQVPSSIPFFSLA